MNSDPSCDHKTSDSVSLRVLKFSVTICSKIQVDTPVCIYLSIYLSFFLGGGGEEGGDLV